MLRAAITSGGKALSIHVDTPGAGGSGYTSISRGSGNYTGIDLTLQHQSSEIFLVDSGNVETRFPFDCHWSSCNF